MPIHLKRSTGQTKPTQGREGLGILALEKEKILEREKKRIQ